MTDMTIAAPRERDVRSAARLLFGAGLVLLVLWVLVPIWLLGTSIFRRFSLFSGNLAA